MTNVRRKIIINSKDVDRLSVQYVRKKVNVTQIISPWLLVGLKVRWTEIRVRVWTKYYANDVLLCTIFNIVIDIVQSVSPVRKRKSNSKSV